MHAEGKRLGAASTGAASTGVGGTGVGVIGGVGIRLGKPPPNWAEPSRCAGADVAGAANLARSGADLAPSVADLAPSVADLARSRADLERSGAECESGEVVRLGGEVELEARSQGERVVAAGSGDECGHPVGHRKGHIGYTGPQACWPVQEGGCSDPSFVGCPLAATQPAITTLTLHRPAVVRHEYQQRVVPHPSFPQRPSHLIKDGVGQLGGWESPWALETTMRLRIYEYKWKRSEWSEYSGPSPGLST